MTSNLSLLSERSEAWARISPPEHYALTVPAICIRTSQAGRGRLR
jgi:hypothetical protein